MLVRPGSGLPIDAKVLRPITTGLPIVTALKRFMSDFSRHGMAPFAPDHTVLGDRNDENDFHHRVPCASAVSAGPPTRQIVHSSISSAPSDL